MMLADEDGHIVLQVSFICYKYNCKTWGVGGIPMVHTKPIN